MKPELINELARLRDELRNVAVKIDNALNNVTEMQNTPNPAPQSFASFVVLSQDEEHFLRNWMDSNARPTFTDWERSFLDSVFQRNMKDPTIKLTSRQYDSFLRIFAKHTGA